MALRKHVLMGRPIDHYGFPVALYNKHLATLQYKLNRLDDYSKESAEHFEDFKKYKKEARKFFEAAVKEHDKEESRTNASISFLKTCLGENCKTEYQIPRTARSDSWSEISSNPPSETSAKVDVYFLTVLDTVDIPRVIVEVKKYDGEGDPVAQSVKDFAESVYGKKVRYVCYLALLNLLKLTLLL